MRSGFRGWDLMWASRFLCGYSWKPLDFFPSPQLRSEEMIVATSAWYLNTKAFPLLSTVRTLLSRAVMAEFDALPLWSWTYFFITNYAGSQVVFQALTNCFISIGKSSPLVLVHPGNPGCLFNFRRLNSFQGPHCGSCQSPLLNLQRLRT